MNIFALDENPKNAAMMHCDKHVSKMVVESAQMLSTAHRVIDGVEESRPSKSGKRMVKYWKHTNDDLEESLYKACHVNHPSSKWTRDSVCNYLWHYELFKYLSEEYQFRYGRTHLTWQKLGDVLASPPVNMSKIEMTPFELAMGSNPECMNHDDPVGSYRAFYMTKQDRFNMVWSKRDVPYWFKYNEVVEKINSL